MRTSIAAAVLLLALPVPARAQLADIQRRIAALEAELAQLKALVQQQPRQEETPPDPGDVTFAAGLDTYYAYNFNRPVGRVNLLRAYDVTSNNFSLNQASVIVEAAPDVDAGRRFGGRVDFQFGQATETLQGSLANEPRPWVYRNVFQAYGTYVVPVGNGLTIDFGKWASSLGTENNYTKDQLNYSRSFWFNFLPFYHAGARLNYKLHDKAALNYWVVNGTQQTEAFNNFKDQSVGVVIRPAKNVTWTSQYYFGQEHPDVQPVQSPAPPTLPTQAGLSVTPVIPYFTGKLHIVDSYATWQATPSTTLGIEADYVLSRNPPPAPDAHVYGGAAYVRRQLTDRTAVAGRAEYLRDHNGLFTGLTQSLKETTFTYDYRPAADGFLIRAEWRRDFSDTPFFLTKELDKRKTDQHTATLGIVWWWGTKRQTW